MKDRDLPSIESLGHPLAYKMRADRDQLTSSDEFSAVRVEAHALGGMQKEALVYQGSTRSLWRMVSDEGPYLNGTDLAPFPLAFFSVGMVVFRSIRRVITPPSVSTPSDNGVTSKRTICSSTSPARIAP